MRWAVALLLLVSASAQAGRARVPFRLVYIASGERCEGRSLYVWDSAAGHVGPSAIQVGECLRVPTADVPRLSLCCDPNGCSGPPVEGPLAVCARIWDVTGVELL